MTDDDFATQLRRLRMEKVLSVEDVADLFWRTSAGLVTCWESGELVPDPDLQKTILEKLAATGEK